MRKLAGNTGRWLEISPSRFPGWIDSFASRHGGTASDSSVSARSAAPVVVAASGDDVTFTAPDGVIARCQPPFWESRAGIRTYADAPASEAAAEIAAHAVAERTVGVLLVRLGGYAAGVFTGSPPRLAASKTGSRLVHGRSAAGGWSQQRFARRREKQAAEALHAAGTAAAGIWGDWADGKGRSVLDVVVLGGDKRAVAEVTEDPRLAPYLERVAGRFLTVPDPRLDVLKDSPRRFLAVRIRLTEPAA
ncbi:MAG TPA: acVLRF1 family peptidyl-tRNA hydrolase [Trebonia sp.]|nr:acVLRF1 family peptidyl-tRNA hydrolase [Trebonia sp.]